MLLGNRAHFFFSIYRQTKTTRKNARKFLTNVVGQTSNRQLVRTVIEGKKWEVVQATLRHAEYNPTPQRYVLSLGFSCHIGLFILFFDSARCKAKNENPFLPPFLRVQNQSKKPFSSTSRDFLSNKRLQEAFTSTCYVPSVTVPEKWNFQDR